MAEPGWGEALERLRGAYSDRTLENSAKAFLAFEAWCAARGLKATDAGPEALAAYLEAYFETHAAQSVMLQVYGIRQVLLALRRPDPSRSEAVRLAIRRGKRRHGLHRRRPTRPINAELRDRLRAACGEALIGVRNRAILSVGYAALARAGELLRMRVEDVAWSADGLARVRIWAEKQDPGGSGSFAYLDATAAADLAAWLAAARLESGPIFRCVFGTKVAARPIQVCNLNHRIKAIAEAAGLDAATIRGLSSHSLRIGAVHDLTISGRSLLQIMRAGRWRNPREVADYARHAPVNAWAAPEDDIFPVAEAATQAWRLSALAGGRRGLPQALERAAAAAVRPASDEA